MNALADEAEEQLRKRGNNQTPRDKWITPLLDLKAVTGAVDPDQVCVRGGVGVKQGGMCR
jgi:hypothetical protein